MPLVRPSEKSARTSGQTSSASPATTASACFKRLLGGERDPGAAEHHAPAAGAELAGEIVGARDLRAHGRDADDVALVVEVDVLHQLVDERDVVAPGVIAFR